MNTTILTINEQSFKEEALAKIETITQRKDFTLQQFTINDFAYQVIQSHPKFSANGTRELHINATHIAQDGSGKNVLRSVKTNTFTFEQSYELAIRALENFLGRGINAFTAH